MWMSASAAARITEVPSGTATARPSISSATLRVSRRSGVAKSLSARDRMSASSSWGRDRQIVADESHIARRQTEILRKIFQRAQHRQRREAAERAQRTELHRVAQIAEHLEILARTASIDNVVDQLGPANRSYSARRAFAARFDRAKLHRVARHPRHVDGVVKHDDSAVAEDSAARGNRLKVQRSVEHRVGKISAQRSSDLNRANRPAAGGAVAVVFDDFAQRHAHRGFDQSRPLRVARELKRYRAARVAGTVVAEEFRAALDNDWDRREGNHVVDERRFTEETFQRGNRRLETNHPAPALDTFEHRRFLAADVRAGA